MLLMLVGRACTLEDGSEVDGDRRESMQHNLNCTTTVNSEQKSLHIEDFGPQPELHFHVDVQVPEQFLFFLEI